MSSALEGEPLTTELPQKSPKWGLKKERQNPTSFCRKSVQKSLVPAADDPWEHAQEFTLLWANTQANCIFRILFQGLDEGLLKKKKIYICPPLYFKNSFLNHWNFFSPILVANIIKKVKNKINLGAPKQTNDSTLLNH